MESSNEQTETNVDRSSYTRVEKRQEKIEGWSVGILGALALLGTTYASLQYSGW